MTITRITIARDWGSPDPGDLDRGEWAVRVYREWPESAELGPGGETIEEFGPFRAFADAAAFVLEEIT